MYMCEKCVNEYTCFSITMKKVIFIQFVRG
jgi:hypothetical protein